MLSPELHQRLIHNVECVRAAIGHACARVGRPPDSVRLVAVTKYAPPPVIHALLAAGVADLGENQVQQLTARALTLGADLAGWPEPPAAAPAGPERRPRWHMVGHLQRNKVKLLLPHARIVHSLDSERLARTLQELAERQNVNVDVFVEVNAAAEASKFGVAPAELEPLITVVRALPRLHLRGLMTMAPLDPEPERARPHFARLRALLEQLRSRGVAGPECVHLSMGMSQDYAVAVEEGATVVRVGSALYAGLPPAVLNAGP